MIIVRLLITDSMISIIEWIFPLSPRFWWRFQWWSSDSRKDVCYAHFRDGQCLNPSTSLVTKSSCCCCTVVLGQPMGWGTPCQACPQPDSLEFEQLCPFGSGKTHSGDGNNHFTIQSSWDIHAFHYIVDFIVASMHHTWLIINLLSLI